MGVRSEGDFVTAEKEGVQYGQSLEAHAKIKCHVSRYHAVWTFHMSKCGLQEECVTVMRGEDCLPVCQPVANQARSSIVLWQGY